MEKTLLPSDIKLFVTDSAVRQIQLMQENDYTLEGLSFRIKIGGKGCEGFTYDTGFSELHADDLVIKQSYPLINFELTVLIDPFTAFYTQEATLDYLLDISSNEEGFILTNAADGQHRGKFFKDESRLPPWGKK
ncbi:HesB/IscA family protein [Peredibacter sp. HCB2-198]|uniref:HesB/IscA family protein n=1 Tax=Peredibacter sp. HCB2-198 TaxID=3383025 RepID=UPI0038B6A1A6